MGALLWDPMYQSSIYHSPAPLYVTLYPSRPGKSPKIHRVWPPRNPSKFIKSPPKLNIELFNNLYPHRLYPSLSCIRYLYTHDRDDLLYKLSSYLNMSEEWVDLYLSRLCDDYNLLDGEIMCYLRCELSAMKRTPSSRRYSSTRMMSAPLSHFIKKHIGHVDRYLDINGGDGDWMSPLKDMINPTMTLCGNIRNYNSSIKPIVDNVKYINMINRCFNIEDNSVDVITCMMALHHVEDPETLINELVRIVRVDGIIIIREYDCQDIFCEAWADFKHVAEAMCSCQSPDFEYDDHRNCKYLRCAEIKSMVLNSYNGCMEFYKESVVGNSRVYNMVFKKKSYHI